MNQLKTLATALQKKSQEINLFSSSDREKLESKHFPDAQAVLDFWHVETNDHVLDIGTGGGIPGLVLAVILPDVDFTLLDSTKKKLSALEDVIGELEIKNTQTLWGRVEERAQDPEYREKFDIVTARALADLPTLLEYAVGFLKPDGHFYAWKSGDVTEELERSQKAQSELGLLYIRQHEYKLPGGETRTLICFRRSKPLKNKYPRRVGVPLKTPL